MCSGIYSSFFFPFFNGVDSEKFILLIISIFSYNIYRKQIVVKTFVINSILYALSNDKVISV